MRRTFSKSKYDPIPNDEFCNWETCRSVNITLVDLGSLARVTLNSSELGWADENFEKRCVRFAFHKNVRYDIRDIFLKCIKKYQTSRGWPACVIELYKSCLL